MSFERKYTGTELARALTASHYDSNGYNYIYSYDDIMTLAHGWCRLPRYPSPRSSVIHTRSQQHGEFWLKKSEIYSFERYIGYKLLRYLD